MAQVIEDKDERQLGPSASQRDDRAGRMGGVSDGAALSGVMAVSALFAGCLLRVGWIPSDEGTLAQSALRVYQGQLPGRDFAEVYTGGLSFLHAEAFHLLGANLFSLRICVFCFFLVWLAALYYAARRFLSPLWAAVTTLTAVSWSYPNYVAAMPSWYNLFFATFGAAALLRYIDVRSRRWLFVAGLCGGAAVLVKVVGLYYIAAVLMFLLFVEQSRRPSVRTGRSSPVYSTFCICGLGLYLAGLTKMVWPQLAAGEAYHFLLPSAACVALLVWRERGWASMSSRTRFAALFGLAAPFFAGVAAMAAIFLVPYLASRSVGELLRGVVGSAAARAAGLAGRAHPPGLGPAFCGLVTLVLIVTARYAPWTRDRRVLAVSSLGLAGLVAWAARPGQLPDAWFMAATLTPLAVLLGIAMIVVGPGWGADDEISRQRTMLLVALAAVCSLVQYPFPYVTYFFYTAPLTLLAVVAAVGSRRGIAHRPMLAVLLVYFLGLGAFAMVTRHEYNPDLRFADLHTIPLPRAGGLKEDATTVQYDELIPFLQAHSSNGLLYAGNDCPELYFLSGLTNPTRDDTGAPVGDVLAALQSGRLGLVAINDQSFFASAAASPELRAAAASLLPHVTTIGKFSVYWR